MAKINPYESPPTTASQTRTNGVKGVCRAQLVLGGMVALLIMLLFPAYFRAETAVVKTICTPALPQGYHPPWRREDAVAATKQRMRAQFACLLAVIAIGLAALFFVAHSSDWQSRDTEQEEARLPSP